MKPRYPKCKATKKRQSKQTLPQGVFTATVSELLTDGRGLAEVDGKKVMITGALPDETVAFTYSNQKKQFFEGELVEVVSAAAERVAPRCAVFSRCGGCVLQHLDADKQMAFKQRQVLGNLSKQLVGKAKQIAVPLTANHWGYRHRARVGLIVSKTDKKRVEIGFRGRASSMIVATTGCDVLAPELSALFTPIADMVATLSAPASITQVEMTLSETAENNHRVALTFRHVKALSDDDRHKLSQFAKMHVLDIYLQGGDNDSLMALNHKREQTYFLAPITENDEASRVKHSHLRMAFLPYHFTQVNFAMNRKMLEQALDWLDLQADDCVLDLFCGLGNFTLPIAQRVNRVVGVEGSKALVNWAKRNAEKNTIDNAEFHQADLTQNTQMMAWRVKYQYNKVLIDPPRAGALEVMPLIHALKPEKICYVSCHAATLARDLQMLVNDYGYRLERIGAMDMFPQTAHVEAMALLTKK